MEAELYALTGLVKEIIWFTNLLKEIRIPITLPISVNIDNQSTIKLCESNRILPNSKHIVTKQNFIRDEITAQRIKLTFTNSEQNIADMFTKALTRTKFEEHASKITVRI